MEVVTNVLAALPPRHLQPPPPNFPHERPSVVAFVRTAECVAVPRSLRKAWSEMAQMRQLPVGVHASDGNLFKRFMEIVQASQDPEWKRETVYAMTGRTEEGWSVLALLPCPAVTFCIEFPRSLDGGETLITDEQMKEYLETVRTCLQLQITIEVEEAEQEAAEQNRYNRYAGGAPIVDFSWSFAWRERANGYVPDPANGNKAMTFPVARIEVPNEWVGRRLVKFLDGSNELRISGCVEPVTVQPWETTRHVKTDLRVRSENQWPSTGWFKFSNYKAPSWTWSHCDGSFVLSSPKDVEHLSSRIDPGPRTDLSFDLECISGPKDVYLRLLQENVERFPNAADRTNTVVIIGNAVRTADGRQLFISLEWNDKPGETRIFHETRTFEDTGANTPTTYRHEHFLISNERLMICTLRDLMVFYDADSVGGFNIDNFDWPYLMTRMGLQDIRSPFHRFHAMGRLLTTRQDKVYAMCRHIGGVLTPVFSDKDKATGCQFHSMPIHEYSAFPQAMVVLTASGRVSADTLTIVKAMAKSDAAYVFKKFSLDNVAERFLKRKKLKVNLFGYWHRVDALVPPETQRTLLVNYCMIDALLPQLILEVRKLIPFHQLISVTTNATVHDAINRGQLARVTAMFIKKAWSDNNWVCNYSLEKSRTYTGALVIPPEPITLAGIEDVETAVPLPEQPKLPVDFDLSVIVVDTASEKCLAQQVCACGCGQRAHVVSGADEPMVNASFDRERKCVRGVVFVQACKNESPAPQEVWVPAQFINPDIIATLDYQSLYPSIMGMLNLCGSTSWNPAAPLNAAENCCERIRARKQAMSEGLIGPSVEHRIAALQAQWKAGRQAIVDGWVTLRRQQLAQAKVASARANVFVTDTAEEDAEEDAGGGEREEADRATSTYVQGDGDCTAEMPDRDFFFSVQESDPDNPSIIYINKFARHHLRIGIGPAMAQSSLDERAKFKAKIKVHQKTVNAFVGLNRADVEAAQTALASGTPLPPLEDQGVVSKVRVLAELLQAGADPHDFTALAAQAVTCAAYINVLQLKDIADGQQLIMKIIANSVYGTIAVKILEHILSCFRAAASVTAMARKVLTLTKEAADGPLKEMFNNDPARNCQVMGTRYGDTDSIFPHARSPDLDRVWDFAKTACEHINKKVFAEPYEALSVPGHPPLKCPLNLQFEAVKKFFTIFMRKNYVALQNLHGHAEWDELDKGVATVRRDRARVLTTLLEQLYRVLRAFGNFDRTVMRLMILRTFWIHMEKMVANEYPKDMYDITQRVMTVPTTTQGAQATAKDTARYGKHGKSGSSLPQHVAVAMEIFKKTNEPPRRGDSVTFVLTVGGKAKASADATLADIDRAAYFEKRMWVNLQRFFAAIFAPKVSQEIFTIYMAALTGRQTLREVLGGGGNPTNATRADFRWQLLQEMANMPRQRRDDVKRSALPQAGVKKRPKAHGQRSLDDVLFSGNSSVSFVVNHA